VGPAAESRPHARAVNVRALLRDREFIKVTTYLMPRRSKLHVLEAMERLRRRRMIPPPPPHPHARIALPEMTAAEMVREINWRLGTLPPDDAEAVARYVRRMTQWRQDRRRAEPRRHRP
jgi:hypothetical protein